MADVTPATATTATTSTTPAVNLVPVAATATEIPDKIQPLTRLLQINGIIASPPDTGTLILSTIVGEVTFQLPQLAQAEQQKVLQQLLDLFQSQKPLTAVIQPGDPPTQATLLLPQTAGSATPSLSSSALPPQQPPAPQAIPLPLTEGVTLTAIVLPSLLQTSTPQIATAEAQPVPQQQLQQTTQPPISVSTPASATLSLLNPATTDAIALTASRVADLLRAQPPTTSLSPFVTSSTPASPVNLNGLLLANAIEEAPNVFLNSLQAQSTLPSSTPPTTALPETIGNIAQLFQPGREVQIRIDAITPANVPTPPAIALNDNQIIATVTGKTTNGQLILQAGDVTLYVRETTQAPVGARLLLTVTAAPSDTPVVIAPSETMSYPALQQMLNILAQVDPAAMRQFIETAIPQPNAQLPTTLMLFFHILNQGSPQKWVDPSTRNALLRAEKADLIARLGQELTHATQTTRDNVVGEWRAYPVPIHADGQLQTLNFYVHKDDYRNKGKDQLQPRGQTQIRFLIDMRMTRLGSLQIDGLVQPKKLDMILRSEKALPAGLPQELRDIYIKTLDALGYTGGLSFQTGRQSWLVMQKQGASREA